MKKIFMCVFILCSTSVFAEKWEIRADKISANDADSVTVMFPHRYGPMDAENVCGGPGSVDFAKGSNKNKICQKLGFKSYVRGSAEYFQGAVLMSRVQSDRMFSGGGWFCFGAPVGTQIGIKSLNCER